MKAFYKDFRLGILGGGQLGRMLIQACPNLDVDTAVLDPSNLAPCCNLAGEFIQGDLNDFDSVYAFGKKVDLLTIEIENVNVEALYQLEKEGLPVYPQPRVIEIIQDKRKQKQFYLDNDIPTADFVLVENRADIERHANFLPAFNKLGRGGYDGGGVVRLQSAADISKGFDAPGLLEKSVDLDREISVIAARNEHGEVAVYPIVECVFNPQYHLVDYLIAPSTLPNDLQNRAVEIASTLVKKLEIIGILAVEMFVSRDGEVLVNEAAPRPHNSGHQTINANVTSQYEQLLRAILNLPLGSTAINRPSAMVNLLGEEGYTGPVHYTGLNKLLVIPGVHLYLYGKAETRPWRKMGHVTIVDEDRDNLIAKVEQVKQTIKAVSLPEEESDS
jgi:5-(carboxyamino)imidazole ribonucleotide synthase